MRRCPSRAWLGVAFGRGGKVIPVGLTLPDAAIVRIFDDHGEVIGAGFLAGPEIVITCAHVVADALGFDESTTDGPIGTRIQLDFPRVKPGHTVHSEVVRWHRLEGDGSGDLAGLKLVEPVPAGAGPLRLVERDDLRNSRYRAFGFSVPTGAWSSGWIMGRQ